MLSPVPEASVPQNPHADPKLSDRRLDARRQCTASAQRRTSRVLRRRRSPALTNRPDGVDLTRVATMF